MMRWARFYRFGPSASQKTVDVGQVAASQILARILNNPQQDDVVLPNRRERKLKLCLCDCFPCTTIKQGIATI